MRSKAKECPKITTQIPISFCAWCRPRENGTWAGSVPGWLLPISAYPTCYTHTEPRSCRGVGLPAVLRHGWVTAGLVKAGQCVPRDAGPSAGSALPRAHACPSISVLGCGRGSPLCGAETADGAELGQPSAASGSSLEVHVIYSPDLCFLFHHPRRDASLLFSEQQLRPKNGGSGLSSPELSHKKE